ncbi:putative nonstructural protein 1, partial [Steelhead trout orthomyxovirus-1]
FANVPTIFNISFSKPENVKGRSGTYSASSRADTNDGVTVFYMETRSGGRDGGPERVMAMALGTRDFNVLWAWSINCRIGILGPAEGEYSIWCDGRGLEAYPGATATEWGKYIGLCEQKCVLTAVPYVER